MSEWVYNLTIVCPQALMAEANQLALAIGTSPDDVLTFRNADWTDGTIYYSIANSRATASVFDSLEELKTPTQSLADAGVDVEAMLSAMSCLCIIQADDSVEDILASRTSSDIIVFVDWEPMQALSAMSLTRIDVGV